MLGITPGKYIGKIRLGTSRWRCEHNLCYGRTFHIIAMHSNLYYRIRQYSPFQTTILTANVHNLRVAYRNHKFLSKGKQNRTVSNVATTQIPPDKSRWLMLLNILLFVKQVRNSKTRFPMKNPSFPSLKTSFYIALLTGSSKRGWRIDWAWQPFGTDMRPHNTEPVGINSEVET